MKIANSNASAVSERSPPAGLDQYAGGEHVFRVFQAQSPGAAWEQRGEHLLECLGGIVERGFEYLDHRGIEILDELHQIVT